jgi:adenylate cyclase
MEMPEFRAAWHSGKVASMAMRLRTRIALTVGLSMGLVAAGLAASLYLQASHIQLDEIRYQVQSIAARAAKRIDGDAHARLTAPEFLAGRPRVADLAANADYQAVLEPLWKTYRANHDRRTRIVNIYTMAPAPEGGWMYAVEADVDSDLTVYAPGTLYKEGTCPPEVLERPTADRDFVTDADGTWLTGYAPILDSAGRAVGFVGVDLARADVLDRLGPMSAWFGMLGLAALAFAWVSGWLVSLWVSRPIERLHRSIRDVESGNLENCVRVGGPREIGELSESLGRMIAALRERERLRDLFRRYVPPAVAERILAGHDPRAMLKGERRRVTVLFCDVRGFTGFAEEHPPAEVFATLNSYFAAAVDCIFRHGGTLDKFAGDNVMAVFGAPVAQGDDAARAVACALDMIAAAAEISRQRDATGLPPLAVGIGIHSGVAVAGEVGTAERREYTVIGHHVNIAKRIEEQAPAGGVLVSETVWRETEDLFRGEAAGILTTGSGTEVGLYLVSAARTGAPGVPPPAGGGPTEPTRPARRIKDRPSTRRLPLPAPPSPANN